VDDTKTAMAKLANHVRLNLETVSFIAVGGSNGKTGTKHLIHAALSGIGKLEGHTSPKSFNNDIGVPLTIFPTEPSEDYVVLEMGTNHPGEIAVLTNMAYPDIAVITNVSAEHLEGLGDLMGVRQEEASIVDGLHPQGLLVVNGDDEELLRAVSRFKGLTIKFGLNPKTNDLYATDIVCTPQGTRFLLNGRREIFVPLLGQHSAINALAAIAVGRRLKLTEDDIAAGLANATGPEMRLQLNQIGGVTLLDECYNANPASMKAAIDTLMSLPCTGRRISVLGDMRELGQASDRYHKEMGEVVAAAHPDLLACVGKQSTLIAASARLAGLPDNTIFHFDDSATAAISIPRWLRPGDLVLLKGSRGIHLEKITAAMTDESGLEAIHH
jgi:UDP-N-acetylmuramoyl-tripeptide--D-alanyl-D-alanine ligase